MLLSKGTIERSRLTESGKLRHRPLLPTSSSTSSSRSPSMLLLALACVTFMCRAVTVEGFVHPQHNPTRRQFTAISKPLFQFPMAGIQENVTMTTATMSIMPTEALTQEAILTTATAVAEVEAEAEGNSPTFPLELSTLDPEEANYIRQCLQAGWAFEKTIVDDDEHVRNSQDDAAAVAASAASKRGLFLALQESQQALEYVFQQYMQQQKQQQEQQQQQTSEAFDSNLENQMLLAAAEMERDEHLRALQVEQSTVEQMQHGLASALSQLDALQKSTSDHITKLNLELEQRQTKIETLQANLINTLEYSEAQVEASQNVIDMNHETLNHWKMQMKDLELKLEQARMQRNAALEESKSSQRQIEALTSELGEFRSQMESSHDQIATQAKTKIENLKESLVKWEVLQTNTQLELNNAIQQVQSLEESLLTQAKEAEYAIQQLEGKMLHGQQTESIISAKFEQQQQTFQDVKRESTQKDDTIRKLQKELQQTQNKLKESERQQQKAAMEQSRQQKMIQLKEEETKKQQRKEEETKKQLQKQAEQKREKEIQQQQKLQLQRKQDEEAKRHKIKVEQERRDVLQRQRDELQRQRESERQKQEELRKARDVEFQKRLKEQKEKQIINSAPKKSPPKQSPSNNVPTITVPLLESWTLHKSGEVTGTVMNHSEIGDGTDIITSPLADTTIAATDAIVETLSGSKYKLGTQATEVAEITEDDVETTNEDEDDTEDTTANSVVKKQGISRFGKSFKRTWSFGNLASSIGNSLGANAANNPGKEHATKLGLTGQSVGNGKYLLAGTSIKSTNGRSFIYTAYRSDENFKPIGPALAIKLTHNKEALKREHENYHKIRAGVSRGVVVQVVEHLPTADSGSKRFDDMSALVMEKGNEDLKAYRYRIGGVIERETLRDALFSSLKCVQHLHSARLVWTDLKTENFLIVQDKNPTAEEIMNPQKTLPSTTHDDEDNRPSVSFKGIDFESAMPLKSNPLDYTPEASPPEFARALKADEAYDFVLDYNYDIWSFGMFAYELSTGSGYFEGKTPDQIMKFLADLDTSELEDLFEGRDTDEDKDLVHLISSCLQMDPRKRPSVQTLLKHPFFRGSTSANQIGGLFRLPF